MRSSILCLLHNKDPSAPFASIINQATSHFVTNATGTTAYTNIDDKDNDEYDTILNMTKKLYPFIMWPKYRKKKKSNIIVRRQVNLLYTKDYNVVNPRRNDKPYQGGFFVIRPSIKNVQMSSLILSLRVII